MTRDGFRQRLVQLLSSLEAIAEDHEEVGDTAVREAMSEAVLRSFIKPEPGYELPAGLEMFTPDADARVRTVLSGFLAEVAPFVGQDGFQTPAERLAAFQDGDAESPEGMFFDDFFGYWDPAGF